MKKIRVRIRAVETVFYDKTVEMTPVEWNDFKKQAARGISSGMNVGDIWLDSSDAEDGRVERYEAEAVRKDGKPMNDSVECCV